MSSSGLFTRAVPCSPDLNIHHVQDHLLSMIDRVDVPSAIGTALGHAHVLDPTVLRPSARRESTCLSMPIRMAQMQNATYNVDAGAAGCLRSGRILSGL